MSFFQKSLPEMRLTLRALAYLLRYPDEEMRSHAADLRDALNQETALTASRKTEIERLIDRLVYLPSMQVESEFVEMFDRGRRTSLLLFEHVHGDSRDRGPAMIDLIRTYEDAGLYLGLDEMPDALPVVLEFASTQPAKQAQSFLGETAHIVRVIFSALVDRQSPYASVLAAVLELAGEKAEPVAIEAEPEIDESWAEPEVFGGCSTEGQAKPGQPQPIRIVKRNPSPSQSNHQGAQA